MMRMQNARRIRDGRFGFVGGAKGDRTIVSGASRDAFVTFAAGVVTGGCMQHERELDDEAAEALWELLPASLQSAVARGDVGLAELLEALKAADPDEQLCPWCGCRPVSRVNLGICETCAARRMRHLQEQRLSELFEQRERDRVKSAIRRQKDALQSGPEAQAGQAQSSEQVGGRLRRCELVQHRSSRHDTVQRVWPAYRRTRARGVRRVRAAARDTRGETLRLSESLGLDRGA
jgi:hypothetical protein